MASLGLFASWPRKADEHEIPQRIRRSLAAPPPTPSEVGLEMNPLPR